MHISRIVFYAVYMLIVFSQPLQAGWETSNPFVGVTYSKLRGSDAHPILGWSTSPLSVDVMEIDLDAEGVSFICTPSNGGAPGETDRQTTMNFMQSTNTEIAINTNFWSWSSPNESFGLLASNGSLISLPDLNWPSMNISLNNEIEMITTPGANYYPLGNAFSGNRVVVQNGLVVASPEPDLQPRTAAGYNAAENKLILMTIDGRSPSSVGVTITEVGKLMAQFGATWALNLDGGGSTQMTSNASSAVYVNSPSETYRAVPANLGVHAIPDSTYHAFANFEHGNKATFEYRPGYSGSSYGIIDELSYTQQLAWGGAIGRGAMKVVVADDASASGEWFTRIVSGATASRSQNTIREATGYVGLLAKTTDANTFISLALDDPYTGDRAVRKEMIGDGNWHWYQWNLDDDDQWEAWMTSSDGAINNVDFTIDSVQIWGSADATVYLDEIAHCSTNAVSPPPIAVDDSYQLLEDSSFSVVQFNGLLQNDPKTYTKSLMVTKLSEPLHGTLDLNSDGSLQYTPDTDWNGTDTFIYKTNDGYNDSNVAIVSLQVSSVNDAPVAVPDSYEVPWNGLLVVSREEGLLANDTDVDSGILFSHLVGSSETQHGELFISDDGDFVYKPNPGYSGEDTFSYYAFDGTAQSESVTCYLTVGDVEIQGDANRDGIVNELDASVVANHWLQQSGGIWDFGDFNGDNIVDEIDVTILAANWGYTVASASVPEAGMLNLLFYLACITCGFRTVSFSQRIDPSC